MFILLIASIIIILILAFLVSYFFTPGESAALGPKDHYDNASPGIFLTMVTLPTLVAATDSTGPLPDVESLSLDACTKLGRISKPLNGIVDLTLLNKRLPLNFYSSRSSVTNVGILLDPKPLQKFIQCMGVRDRGSDLRRCDTDFSNSSPAVKVTSGDYQFPLRKTGEKCTCTFDKKLSNRCSSGPSIAGCGAKCSDTGKVCGEVTWCTAADFGKEPTVEGGFCAWNPNNMTEWIDATIAWNKAYLRNKETWDVPHSENEVDAIVADTPQNQQIINDAILAFVMTDSCGATKSGTLTKCPAETMAKLTEKMKAIVAQFNKIHGRTVKLYLVKNNEAAVAAWEASGYVSDWSAFTEIPVPVDFSVSPVKRMYTYRVADGVDGILEKNTGDVAGDNSYIGGEFCGRHPDTCQDAVLTRYEVEYDATPVATPAYTKPTGTSCYVEGADCQQVHSGFGNYSLCNPGGVVGGTGPYKCTKCADAKIGQCDVYPGVETDRFSGGKWYSWPGAKMCGDADPIGTGGCRWKVTGTPKSVSVRDLVKSGYKTLDVAEYQKMQRSCKQKKSCVDRKVSAYVKQNQEKNIETINKSFL